MKVTMAEVNKQASRTNDSRSREVEITMSRFHFRDGIQRTSAEISLAEKVSKIL